MDYDDDFDPLNISDPVSSYLFLSDDAQDEMGNSQKRKMKCQLCGHKFTGEKTDYCPMCYSSRVSEIR